MRCTSTGTFHPKRRRAKNNYAASCFLKEGKFVSDIYRVCPKCGGRSNETTYRFCPTCGADSDLELAVSGSSLATTASKAVLPILASVAGMALRFGWKLLQNRMAASAVHNLQSTTPVRPPSVEMPTPSKQLPNSPSRRRIHIRSARKVSDSKGNWRSEDSEHIIDIDDNI